MSPNKFHFKYVCFGGRKTREERKIHLKIRLFGFHEMLVIRSRQWPLSRWFHPQLWLVHLNLSASASGRWIWARAQILNGPIRFEDETTLRAVVVADLMTSLWEKVKRRILRQIFRSSRVFRPPKHTYLQWHLFGFLELLVLFRFGTFPFEEKAICGVTSGQRWMEWSAFHSF